MKKKRHANKLYPTYEIPKGDFEQAADHVFPGIEYTKLLSWKRCRVPFV